MDVVLCWHMHQPEYRLGGRYVKPWVWLHAIKDYSDMAAHIEGIAGARAVVNFSPLLIEQLQDYPRRIRAMLERGEPIGDVILDALAGLETGSREALLAQLLRVNEQRMKSRFVQYARLADKARSELAGGGVLGAQEMRDMLVWYVIAWLGESLRGLPLVELLVRREAGFSAGDLRDLLVLLGNLIGGILPRYRKLAARGVIELSVTPYAHPILPLLLDFESARDAMPDAPLPDAAYPGGEARCHWHLGEARRVFASAFGAEPKGCWPAEGALSQAALLLIAQQGFRWTASGSRVLRNSLRGAGEHHHGLPHLGAWGAADGPACFFRDDGLSDLIGFEYQRWPAKDAVEDFLSRLERHRAEYLSGSEGMPVLSIIMDGENAWEYYPHNGWDFLEALYTRLADHPTFKLTTFSEVLGRNPLRPLPELCAGSWVHGSFATWIGDPARNRAWVLLANARLAVDAALESGREERGPHWDYSVLRQLAICEASDWFWWLSEGDQLQDGPEFDALFRAHLRALYDLLGLAPPSELERPLTSAAGGEPEFEEEIQGAMRRSAPGVRPL